MAGTNSHALALLAVLAISASPASAQRGTWRPRRSTEIHVGVGVDEARLGSSRREIESHTRFLPHPRDPNGSLPFTVQYRGGRASTIVVSLSDTLGVRVTGAHFFRPNASFDDVTRALGDCAPLQISRGRAARCLGGALTVVTVNGTQEVGFAVTRFEAGNEVRLQPGRSLGPLRIGMSRSEVRRQVRLSTASPHLYPESINASDTVPYAVRYDSAGRVSAIFIHQAYLPGSLLLGATSNNRFSLSATNPARERNLERQRARLPAGAHIHQQHGYIFGVSAQSPTTASSSSGRAPSFLRVSHDRIGALELGMSRSTVEGLVALSPHPRFSAMTVPYNVIYDRAGHARIIAYMLTGAAAGIHPAEGVRVPPGATWTQIAAMSGLRCATPEHAEGGSTLTCLGGRLRFTRGSTSSAVWARIGQ